MKVFLLQLATLICFSIAKFLLRRGIILIAYGDAFGHQAWNTEHHARKYYSIFYRFPRIDFEMLKEHSEGLIVSTACVAGMPAAISCRGEARGKNFDQIQLELENMADCFVDCVGENNFFLELQFNALASQHTSNKHLLDILT